MLACRSLGRIKFQAWGSASNGARSNLSRYFETCTFSHCLRAELKMERKGKKVDIDGKKQKSVMQVWRAVSTQPGICQGDNETTKLESQLGEAHHIISSNVSTSITENTNSEVLNEPIDTDSCRRTENSDNDATADKNMIPPEKHSLSMEIGSSLWRFIKGKEGRTLEEIEQETQVKVIFPSNKKEESITIEGTSAESVTKAFEKIQSIIYKAINSPQLDYSHFVSLPLAIHPELVDKLVSFQNKVLGVEALDRDECLDNDTNGDTADGEDKDPHLLKPSKVSTELETEKATLDVKEKIDNDDLSLKAPIVAVELKTENSDAPVKVNMTISLVSYPPKAPAASASKSSLKLKDSGIEKSIFIKPKTFHLTVIMLKLWNTERVKKAAEVLESISPKVVDALENQPISIRLKGLETMRGSLAKARVVYAPVEVIGGEGRLLRACQVIIDAFVEAGLVLEKDAQQKLKLHATIMNARHRERKRGTKIADSFDARNIFKQYGSMEWGEYNIKEAHLSQRFVFDENGYYHCCASIPFPDNVQAD